MIYSVYVYILHLHNSEIIVLQYIPYKYVNYTIDFIYYVS